MASTHTTNANGIQNLEQDTSNVNINTVERFASLAGGGLLVLLGIGQSIRGRKFSIGGTALATLGSVLLYRGATNHCYVYQALGINTTQKNASDESIRIEKTVTVNRSQEDLYHFWQDFGATNIPSHFQENSANAANRSQPHKDELEAWNTLKATITEYSGYVHFENAPQDRGTEIRAIISYTPLLGKVGNIASKFTGKAPDQQLTENLRHFKEVLEAGEIPTTEGQPAGR